MERTITYCVSCTTKISGDAEMCPHCGAEQGGADVRPGSGAAVPPPAGWQAARPPASPTGYTVEEP